MTDNAEHPRAEQIADRLTALGVQPYMSGGKWRFEFTEEQVADFADRLIADVEKERTR